MERQGSGLPTGDRNDSVRCMPTGVCNGTRTGGPWSLEEQRLHINCLELLTATLAVQFFLKDRTGASVQLQLNNQTAVAYINNLGGQSLPN